MIGCFLWDFQNFCKNYDFCSKIRRTLILRIHFVETLHMNQISTCATVGSKIVCLFFFFIRNNIQRTIQINSITKKSLRCLYIPEANSHMGKQVPFGLSVFMHLMLKSW